MSKKASRSVCRRSALDGLVIVIRLLAVVLPLTTLARTTSAIILVIFALVNLSLWRITHTDPDRDGRGPRFPIWLPLVDLARA